MQITPFNRTHKVSSKVRHSLAELQSLGIEPKRLNEFNDDREMDDLVDNIKLTLYQDYKSENCL
jgi:hypothetical protein